MLKKVMTMVCAAVMVVGMAVPAFAASPTSTVTVGSTSNPITIDVSNGAGKVEVATSLTTEQEGYVEAVNNVLDSNDAENVQESLAGSGVEVSDTTANIIAKGDVTTLEKPVEVKQNGDDPVILSGLEDYDYVLMLVDNEKSEKFETELISVKVNSDGTATVGSGLIVGFVNKNTSNN